MINNKEIEKRLSNAFDAAAPDMLDDLMAELQLTEPAEPLMREKIAEDDGDRYKKSVLRRGHIRTLLSAAAALILMVGGISVWKISNQAVALVDIDVNPSVELAINSREKVVEARALNEDGEVILAGLDLKGIDAEAACNAIVSSMMAKGYLNDQTNGLLVSVRSDDSSKGIEMEEKLSSTIDAYLGNSTISPAILGQYIENDAELEDFAGKNGISVGKAWLIRRLLQTGGRKMTEQSLLELSTQDMIVLVRERNAEGGTMRGTPYMGEYIGYEKALEAALSAAGLNSSQITDPKVEMDCENGSIIYEVEFTSGGREFEYEVMASTGQIVESEDDMDYDDNDDDDDSDDSDDD